MPQERLLLACQFVFFRYLRMQFSTNLSLSGVLMLDVFVGFCLSYILGPSVIETTDILNLLVYCVCLSAIFQDRMPLLLLVLTIGLLNRETAGLIACVLLLKDWRRHWNRGIAMLILAIGLSIAVRLLVHTPSGPVWFTFESLGRNIPLVGPDGITRVLVANGRLVVLIGPLLVIGLQRFRELPEYYRTAASILPFLLLTNYLFGSIIEARLWMPVFPVLIPMALSNLAKSLPEERDQAASSG